MEIKVVSFDMEGTLVDHSFSRHIWESEIPSLYAKKHRVPIDEAHKRVISGYQEIGEGRPEWYDIRYWWNRLELPEEWKDVLQKNKHRCKIFPDVPEALFTLGNHFKLIVSSNTIREFLDIQLQIVDYPFVKSFSAPSDFGCVKSSAEFYKRVCHALNAEPREVAHVGDHYNFDYVAAEAAGIHAFYLDRTVTRSGPDVIHLLTELEKILYSG